jgi:hypothetical protein
VHSGLIADSPDSSFCKKGLLKSLIDKKIHSLFDCTERSSSRNTLSSSSIALQSLFVGPFYQPDRAESFVSSPGSALFIAVDSVQPEQCDIGHVAFLIHLRATR